MLRTAWIVDLESPHVTAEVMSLRASLVASGHVDLGAPDTIDALRLADVVLVWADRPLAPDLTAALAERDVRVVLAGPTLRAADPERVLGEAAGILLGATTPVHDVRVRSGPAATAALRASGHLHAHEDHNGVHEHVHDRVPLVEKAFDDVEVLRMARVGLNENPVLTWRPATATAAWTLGSTPEAVADRDATRALLALLRHMCGQPEPASIGVGLLGYGAIGHEHSRAVRSVHGLELAAVCDTSAERRAAAGEASPGIATTESADALIERDDVDLVVVSTPPSTHASWALRAIRAGKHVIVEKPFAIATSEADEVLAEAEAAGLLAVVYQNRRYDPDHLAVRRLVRSGALGEVFHIETFVGGYGHPCNLWHSDEGVSGGAFYDWGSHVFDQILDLVPTDIDYVTASAHKLRWHDVTNSDHSRTTIRFVDGSEAEFVHSDLAAVLKPRWYVLGTEGAVVGNWRVEKINGRNDIGTLVEDHLAPADATPALEFRAGDGSVTAVATPAASAYGFHREVSDRIRLGLAMTVTGAQSRRVLAVMEAATLSAADAGRPVAPR